MESTETQHLFPHRTSASSRHPACFWQKKAQQAYGEFRGQNHWAVKWCQLLKLLQGRRGVGGCLLLFVFNNLSCFSPSSVHHSSHHRLCLSCSSLLGPAAPLCVVHPCVQRCRVWWRLCRTKGFACSRSVRNVCRTASTCGAMQPRYRISTIGGQIDAQRLALVYHMSFFWGTSC